MDNSVQELQFLDLSGLTEGDQTEIKSYLHADLQLDKLSWGDQSYSAPEENDAVETTVEHYAVASVLIPSPSEAPPPLPPLPPPPMYLPTFYSNGPQCQWVAPPQTDEQVNGADDNSIPEPLATTADVDVDEKPLPAPVQELSPNDVALIPAHQHPDPGPPPPVTVAAAGPAVSHGPPHHPQDYHSAGLPQAQHALQTNMYMPQYGIPTNVNMGFPITYNYQGQPQSMVSRGGRRKTSVKPCNDPPMYNQEAHMVMQPLVMDYQTTPYYNPQLPVYYEQPQGSEYYNAYAYMMPFNPPYSHSLPPYAEPAATKGPPENKKTYSGFYPNVQPKHDLPPKSKTEEKMEQPREFKPSGMDNRSKPLDRVKPPQSALKITKPDNYKKPVTVKLDPAENVNASAVSVDDKTGAQPAASRGPRPLARAPPPGRHSTSRQLSQEPPPINSPPHVPKMFPMQPAAAPIIPVPLGPATVQPVVIPINTTVPPIAVPVPPGSISVLPVPQPVATAPPSLPLPAVPLESLPGPAVLDVELHCAAPVVTTSVAPAPPRVLPPATPLPVMAPPVTSAVASLPPAGPSSAHPAATPSVASAPPATTAPAPPVSAPKGPGATETPQSTPAPAAAPTYARVSAGQGSASKAPVSSGDKPTAEVKPYSNSEEPESKSQTAPPLRQSLPQDKPTPQSPKPPANAVKVSRMRKSLSAVVKNEPTDKVNAQAATSATHSAPPHPGNTSFPSLPVSSNSEASSDSVASHSSVPSNTTPRTHVRFQNPGSSQPQSQSAQQSVVSSPVPGSAPQPVPHTVKPSPGTTPPVATPASEGPVPQTPAAAAKQPTTAHVEASAAAASPAPAPAAPAQRSYAGALSKKSAPYSHANSVAGGDKPTAEVRPFSNDSSEGKSHYSHPDSESSSWEHRKSSTTVLRPLSAPLLPSPKDPDLLRLGDFLSKYKLNHNTSSLQPRGLSNRGNWCYIHATLQALLACPPFYNLMRALPHHPKDCNPTESCTPIIDSIVKFIQEFPSMKRTNRNARARDENATSTGPDVAVGTAFEPSYVYRMLSAIRSNTFKVEGRQEDAEEFLLCLLNGLHDEMSELIKMVAAKNSESAIANGDVATNGDLSQDEGDWTQPKKKKTVVRRADFGRTPLSDIFRGRLRCCVTRDHANGHTHTHTHTFQPFFTLQLDIEKAKSVNEALELFGSRDQLEGVTCAKTKKEVTAWQQVELEDLPPVLLLHLKCFDYKMDGCSKLCRPVEYPIDLKVPTKSNCTTSKGGKSSNPKMYKLFAVVYHDGKEATKGHYLADAFHIGYNQWLRYDDSSVTVVRPEQVLETQLPRVPYLLYYRRQDTF